MKGILLAGGNGTRLAPLTDATNKHLLPVGDRLMVAYPLMTLAKAGVTDVLLVTNKGQLDGFKEYLGDGSVFGVRLSYAEQDGARGIADALSLGEAFAEGGPVTVILGDNIFAPDFVPDAPTHGCTLTLAEASEEEARRFGCVLVDDARVIDIEEKPKNPKSRLVSTGLYQLSPDAFRIIRTLVPSSRDELEITDLIKAYVANGDCGYRIITAPWFDAGTHESLAAVRAHLAAT